MRQAIRLTFCAAPVLAALVFGPAAPADEPKQPEAKKDAPARDTEQIDEEHRRAAQQLIDGIEVELLDDEKWTKVKRIEKPVLYFGDPTRGHNRGSVWLWGEKGRPVAVLELFRNGNAKMAWVCSLCNTSGGKVRASRDCKPWWRENESVIELKDVPAATAPAADATVRGRQIKQLAGKFTGHQFWNPDNSRFELRRLEKPLHTYRDPDAGALDGALYALANGTNPEVLLFLEARANPKGAAKPTWRFAVGRTSHAELHLLYDDKEVFEAARADRARLSGPDKPYWVITVDTAAAEPKKP